MKAIEIAKISNLSIPEKILFFEELWDSIAMNEEQIALPESHKAGLDQRLKKHLAAPGEFLTLEDLTCIIHRNFLRQNKYFKTKLF